MNRQSQVTLFVLCSLFVFNISSYDFTFLKDKIEKYKEQKMLVGKQVAQQREFVLPQDAILKAHIQFTGNEAFKKHINAIVKQMVEEQQFNNNVITEYPRCRDP